MLAGGDAASAAFLAYGQRLERLSDAAAEAVAGEVATITAETAPAVLGRLAAEVARGMGELLGELLVSGALTLAWLAEGRRTAAAVVAEELVEMIEKGA